VPTLLAWKFVIYTESSERLAAAAKAAMNASR